MQTLPRINSRFLQLTAAVSIPRLQSLKESCGEELLDVIKFREIDPSSHRVRFSLLQEKATLAYLNFHKLYDRLWSSLGEPRSAISDQTLTQRVRDKKEGKNLYKICTALFPQQWVHDQVMTREALCEWLSQEERENQLAANQFLNLEELNLGLPPIQRMRSVQ